MVGLGNIYVDEALFRAGIHPERLANTIDDQELMVLHLKIKETLQEAVDLGGSSVKSYVNGQGDMGMLTMKKLVLIDGNSIAYRAFFALPLLNNDKGTV